MKDIYILNIFEILSFRISFSFERDILNLDILDIFWGWILGGILGIYNIYSRKILFREFDIAIFWDWGILYIF